MVIVIRACVIKNSPIVASVLSPIPRVLHSPGLVSFEVFQRGSRCGFDAEGAVTEEGEYVRKQRFQTCAALGGGVDRRGGGTDDDEYQCFDGGYGPCG